MARTTHKLVTDVLGRNWDGKTDVAPYLKTAGKLVDRVVPAAAARGVTLDSEEQELIERWLGAHFYCVMDPLYLSKQTGGAGGSFQRGSGQDGLTDYARAACQIDTSGALRSLLVGQQIGVDWLGTTCPTTE